MMNDLNKSLISLVRKAGKIMTGVHGVDNDIDAKSGTANFVTVYDVKVQNFLIESIRTLLPSAYFVSEEKENDTQALREERCFIIDPIDGTTNFIHDLHLSAISVAMLCRGEPVLGIVYDPYLDELFYAEKGKGAFLNGNPMRVSGRGADEAIVAFGTSPYTKLTTGEKTVSIMTELLYRCADIRRLGAASLDLAYLAAGRNDLFFEVQLSPWDFAAGMLLIKEAGGIITDMNGDELRFDSPCSAIAGNSTAYPTLLEVVKKYI